jgi:hypothetical protein
MLRALFSSDFLIFSALPQISLFQALVSHILLPIFLTSTPNPIIISQQDKMPFSYHNPSSPLENRRTIDGTGFGKVAIITGCSSGVGLATTQLFLSHQFEVLGVDIKELDYEKIDPRDQERLHFHRGDLTKEGECDEAVRICTRSLGELCQVTCLNLLFLLEGLLEDIS